MEYRVLGNTGLKVSVLGYGASSLGAVFREINEEDALQSVRVSLDMGINFIDVSPFYGLTRAEVMLGRALAGVPRGNYVMATKVGRYGASEFDFSAGRVTASVDESLARMKVDYVDLIQCHDIEFGNLDQIVEETIPALRKVCAAGKARFVGVTGFPLAALKYVTDRVQVDSILSYCHYSLNNTRLEGFIPAFKASGVGVISASPLSMGLLSNRGAPPWHPASPDIREACIRAAEHCRSKGADIAKLAVQMSLSNPDIACTVVGSASSANMRENIAWCSGKPDPELLAEVREILKPVHNKIWPSGRAENN